LINEEWKEIVAEWKGESTFVALNSDGGMVQMGPMDGKPGMGPMQLLLAGLAGCTGMDIASILKKKRQPLQNLQVKVRGKRANDTPHVYTQIEVEYLLWGEGLDPSAIEQAIQLSEEKYCSVGIMLGAAAPISLTYRILTSEEGISKVEEIIK
jgi:putative redox protein